MNEDKRRCPWCWEWIERTATKCNHCQKCVHPLSEAPPPAAESDSKAAPDAQSVEGGAVAPAVVSPDMESSAGMAMWWISAILVYGVLLAGVGVVIPYPRAELVAVLLLAEIVAAYFINRAIWQRARSWPTAKIRKMLIYLVVAVAVLFALGWARRRFLT
ncbi:MAG: hypothetical protein P8X82_07305 [Gemmatimonadales bacterium]